MVLYECLKCNKEFDRKSNYNNHLNKKKSCNSPDNNNNNELNGNIINDISDVISHFTTIKNDVNENTCMYCETVFTRNNNLIRHLNGRCKFKKNFDELEMLKEKLDSVINSNDYLAKQIENLRKENEEFKNTTVYNTKNTKIINNIKNTNQINNGVILNNNLNIQLVQFGNEDIDNMDSNEALNVYVRSTGGNILSNVLKYVHLNEKYPQNHNICITDLSRELVKIFNGKKFIIKKFKNAKEFILGKVVRNTHKLVDKIKNDGNIKITPEIAKKLRINEISVMLIDGCSPDEIVREEIRETEKALENDKNKNTKKSDNNSNKSKKERDFNLAERIRIEHLESKQKGLQDITFERMKEELYNGKTLVK
jgi:hypothetical protein